MSEAIRSFLVSLILLYVILGVAAWLTVARGRGDDDPVARRRIGALAMAAVFIQGMHFAEEWAGGLDERLPALIGMVPWPVEVFVTFNLAWIAVWLASVAGLRGGYHWALFPLWFLALACVANGVIHPLLAAVSGGYFPGLWTSPILALVGVPLLFRLHRLTSTAVTSDPLARGGVTPEP